VIETHSRGAACGELHAFASLERLSKEEVAAGIGVAGASSATSGASGAAGAGSAGASTLAGGGGAGAGSAATAAGDGGSGGAAGSAGSSAPGVGCPRPVGACSAPQVTISEVDVAMPVTGYGRESFKPYPDGRVAYAASGTSNTKIRIARVMPCE